METAAGAGYQLNLNSISIQSQFMCFQEPKDPKDPKEPEEPEEPEEPKEPEEPAKKGSSRKSDKKVCVCARPLAVCCCRLNSLNLCITDACQACGCQGGCWCKPQAQAHPLQHTQELCQQEGVYVLLYYDYSFMYVYVCVLIMHFSTFYTCRRPVASDLSHGLTCRPTRDCARRPCSSAWV